MEHFKRLILITFPLFLLGISAKSQSQDECKYLMVLTYLRTNTRINDQLKALFFRHKKERRNKIYVDFELSKKVEFIGLNYFKDSVSNEELGINKELISNNDLYLAKYFFQPYESKFLDKLLISNDSGIYLTFSRPVGNYIVAAMGNMNPEINGGVNKFGLSMTMLFEFDSLGIVSHVFYYGAANR